jgi:DNA-binding transcriptional MocR family regulator
MLDAMAADPQWWQGRKRELIERRDLLVDLLHDELPSWGVQAPAGGLSVWVHTPRVDGEQLSAAADRVGVHVLPGEKCGVDGAYAENLRICFDRDPGVLREAVQRLAQAHDELTRRPIGRPIAVGP